MAKTLITTENLKYYHQNIEEKINSKQDKISDLESIRNNANLGASALQSIPSEYITETELNNKGYAKQTDLSSKQETLVSGVNIKHINGSSILGSGNLTIATGEDNVQSDWNESDSSSDAFIKNKPSIPTSSTVEDWGFAKKTELTGYTTDAKFNTLSNTVNGKQDKISDLETIRNNANLGASALQSVPSEYITETELNNKGYAKQTDLNNLDGRVAKVEKLSSVNAKANVLWIGTSIPAGDITFSNNGTTQSTTSGLGSNNYPKMVADALDFNLYNNARGASFVCFYPSSEDGTSNWAGKDWTEYQNEVHKGYSLSASMAQVEAKFGPNGLNIPQWLLNNFKSYSYESLIIPYIDGTLASCDTVILDHGYNDRQQILSETSWHISDGEEMVIGSGRDWLLKLQDPFEKTLTAESFFQGCWWSDENAEDTKKYYWKAMVFLCKKIWAVNPRIKIIIGNYFAVKSNIFGAEYGNDRLGEFICLANSGLANWLRCQCVDVHKYTGLYNRNLAAGNDYQIFCPDNVHPHSDSTGRSNRIIAGVYINALNGILYN